MHHLSVDTERNILFMKLEGLMNEQEVEVFGVELLEKVKLLHKEFVIINDMEHFRIATAAAAEMLTELHRKMGDYGVGRVIRILGAKAKTTGILQLQRTAKNSGAYEPIEVATMEDALSLL